MSQALKVGIFAAIVLAALGYLILKVEDLRLFSPEGETVEALFDSVAGLDEKAAVRVAGVRVGQVSGVGLDGRRARVTLLLEKPVRLTEGSRAKIASSGLLGDKYIELIPGPPDAPPLPEGAVLEGETPVSLDQAIARLDAVGRNIEQMTGTLLERSPDGTTSVSRLLDNLEAVSADIRLLVATNREEVASTLHNFESASATLARELPRLADRMEAVLAQVGSVVDENRGDLAASMDNIRELTAGLEPAVADLRTISDRLARGEGTIGKLLSSDEAHDELVATLDKVQGGIDGITDTLGAVQKIELDLGIEGFYLPDAEESQAGFGVDIKTRNDWRYRLGVVSPAFGKEETKFQRFTVTKPDGTVETTTVETLERQDDLEITAMLGVPVEAGDLQLWTGIMEGSFGVQAEYPLIDRKVLLSMEAFDFDREDDLQPHLRLTGRYLFHPNLYIVGGYDDFLTDDRDGLFIGAGIRWRDDDLKYLLGSIPTGF